MTELLKCSTESDFATICLGQLHKSKRTNIEEPRTVVALDRRFLMCKLLLGIKPVYIFGLTVVSEGWGANNLKRAGRVVKKVKGSFFMAGATVL